METSQKPPVSPAARTRTPKEIKTMKIINITVISLIAAIVIASIAFALNGMGDMAVWLAGALLYILWNWRVIRRKYARGL